MKEKIQIRDIIILFFEGLTFLFFLQDVAGLSTVWDNVTILILGWLNLDFSPGQIFYYVIFWITLLPSILVTGIFSIALLQFINNIFDNNYSTKSKSSYNFSSRNSFIQDEYNHDLAKLLAIFGVSIPAMIGIINNLVIGQYPSGEEIFGFFLSILTGFFAGLACGVLLNAYGYRLQIIGWGFLGFVFGTFIGIAEFEALAYLPRVVAFAIVGAFFGVGFIIGIRNVINWLKNFLDNFLANLGCALLLIFIIALVGSCLGLQ